MYQCLWLRRACKSNRIQQIVHASKQIAPTIDSGVYTDKGRAVGSLQLIMGPMFAGKTSELLRRVTLAEAQSLRVVVINSNKDTRYGKNVCATHDGQTRPAFAIGNLLDLLDAEHPASAHFHKDEIDVIAIDESQFFPDLKQFCIEMVEVHGKSVIAAGLHGDFRREVFGDLVNLVPFADHVELLSARCSFCDEKAIFTLRVAANDSQHLVGGSDAYSPVCRRHYVELHNCRSGLPDVD